jgi:hypothetical protein
MKPYRRVPFVVVMAVGLAALAGAAPHAALALAAPQDAAPEGPDSHDEQVEPKTIWPASLERYVGRYAFAQVASPGGLWEKGGGQPPRQVSINEVPATLREKLTHAEIVISDLKLPATIQASQRTSPSGRGKLRYYSETVAGKLVLRNLPGISGQDVDTGTFSGPVVFHLDHQSHSNPSVTGVFKQRMDQEPTWGAATLDSADLSAVSLATPAAKPGSPPSPGTKPPVKAPAMAKPNAADEDDEGEAVIQNARVLRSGMEIFAYVEWSGTGPRGPRRYQGAVRLVKINPNPSDPTPPPARVLPKGPPRTRPLPGAGARTISRSR